MDVCNKYVFPLERHSPDTSGTLALFIIVMFNDKNFNFLMMLSWATKGSEGYCSTDRLHRKNAIAIFYVGLNIST